MITKFNPKDVPSWCNWLAVDIDGAEWAYQSRPSINNAFGCWVNEGGKAKYLHHNNKPSSFENELYTWS